MTVLHVTPGAARQIDEIYAYIARDSPRAAQKVVNRIQAVIDLLHRNPMLGRKTRESGVRSYVVKPYSYVVFHRYDAKRDELHVIRVRHGAMRRAGLADPAQEFRRVAIS